MLPTLSLGPLVLPVPTIILLVGIWAGISFSEKYSSFFLVDRNQLTSLFSYFLFASLLGARISYIASYPGAFSNNWLSIFSINPAMFDWIGGLLIGILVTVIFISRKNLDLWNTLDSLTPAIIVFMFSLGLSFLASGEFLGVPSDLPWSIYLWGANRHPTQIYWLLLWGAITSLIWPLRKNLWVRGTRFLSLLALSSSVLIFLEYFRADSQIILGGLRTNQIFSFLLLIFSLWQLGKRIREFQQHDISEVQNGSDFNL